MSKLLLIDGHSQAYRAFFGVKTPLATSSGELTTAVFGFTRKLFSILKEHSPDQVGVAFDVGDTWRHKEYTEYKGTRERMPDDLRSQMGRIEQLLDVLNIPIVTYPNFEADDVLGTLSRKADELGSEVLILTGDRDLFQLVTERVSILYTSGGPNPRTSVYGLAEVQERYGLTPEQFIDLKALTGDASDNIPGIPGVGEKTAIKFLKSYETLDNLYQHVEEISGPKTKQNLIDAEEQVRINKRLVTIHTNLEMEYDPERFKLQGYDGDQVVQFFTELEFHSLIKQLPTSGLALAQDGTEITSDAPGGQLSLFGEEADSARQTAPPTVEEANFLSVQSEETLAQLVSELKNASCISFDVETDSTDAVQAKLIGLGIAWDAGKSAYIPVAHQEGEQLTWSTQVLPLIAPFFLDSSIPKVAHNTKYDLTVCQRHGLEIAGPLHDTMVMAWILDPASRRLGLKAMAEDELGWQMTEISQLIGSGKKQITIDQVDLLQAGAYCAADVDATIQLYERLGPRLEKAGQTQLYKKAEQPLISVLTKMELAGIRLDTDYLAEMSQQLTTRLSELETQLFKLVGREFNQRSTQQMSDALFTDMAFPTKGMKKTKSGHFSTAVSELERLANADLSADQEQVLETIFEQRQLEKLRSTYVDALPTMVNPETGRLHTSFNQSGAVTGRMSSSNPNLQNIPIRTEIGRKIRRAFVAEPGWLLIAADYSQVELRILAHVAQEPGLLTAFQEDQDIHAATAARLFDVPITEVDKSQRGLAKTINFATIYGVSAFGLSSRTEMGPKQAQQFLDQYFETYPQIQVYIDNTLAKAKDEGYVETLLGRKRFFHELQSGRLPFNQRTAIERAAMNAPIQGTAADIMKLAMIELSNRLAQSTLQARMLLQVHDELVLEVPPNEQNETAALIREVMESAFQLDVPLKVDIEIGENWYEMNNI
ncbi:MAG: DNA polymerase I [Chloroflexota bacterium]